MKTRSILIIENRIRHTISQNEQSITELQKRIKFLKQDTIEKQIILKKLEEIQEAVQQVGEVVFHEEFIPDFISNELPFHRPTTKSHPEGFVPTHIVSQKKKQAKQFCVNCSVCISGEFEYQKSQADPTRCASCAEKYLSK